jgi:hypothetical protein
MANAFLNGSLRPAGLSLLTSVIMGAIVTVGALILAVSVLSRFTLKGEAA